MRYRTFFTGLLVVAVASVSCQDEIKKRIAGDPDPAGMGALGASAAYAGASVIAGLVSTAAEASRPKAAPAAVVVGVFPAGPPLDCDNGNVTFTGDLTTNFSATFNTCVSDADTFTGGAVVSNMVLRTCNEDGQNTDVPESLSAVVDATVTNTEGFSITLTGLGFNFSNPSYSEGTGGTCSLQSANIQITGGSTSTQIAGETITTTVPPGTLTVTFVDGEGITTMTVDGNVTINAPCTDGEFAVQIVTEIPLVFPEPQDPSDSFITDPTAGRILANGEAVDFTQGTIPPPCTGFGS